MLSIHFHFICFKFQLILTLCLNDFARSWTPPEGGCHKRKVNGILGILCKQHYPGMVLINERIEMADTFDHYAAQIDVQDRDGRRWRNKLERVINKLWVSLSHYIAQHIAFY